MTDVVRHEVQQQGDRVVQELAKTPESSPQYPHLTRQVEQLLDRAALAFQEASAPTTAELNFDELYQEVTHHAQALIGSRGSGKTPRSGEK